MKTRLSVHSIEVDPGASMVTIVAVVAPEVRDMLMNNRMAAVNMDVTSYTARPGQIKILDQGQKKGTTAMADGKAITFEVKRRVSVDPEAVRVAFEGFIQYLSRRDVILVSTAEEDSEEEDNGEEFKPLKGDEIQTHIKHYLNSLGADL